MDKKSKEECKLVSMYWFGEPNSDTIINGYRYSQNWNHTIDLLRKLTPELESLKDKGSYDRKEEFGMVLCFIETWLTMYDHVKLYETIIEGIVLINKYKQMESGN